MITDWEKEGTMKAYRSDRTLLHKKIRARQRSIEGWKKLKDMGLLK